MPNLLLLPTAASPSRVSTPAREPLAARIAEERIRQMFAVTEFDPDEVFGPMDSREVAKFRGIPCAGFR